MAPAVKDRALLISAAGLLDARRAVGGGVGVLVEQGPEWPAWRVLAAGPTDEVGRHEAAAGALRLDRPDGVLIPGLVNAHTHLDLTAVGPRRYDPEGGFCSWIEMVRAARTADAGSVLDAVTEGVARSLRGGVVAVGDIAGASRIEPGEALASSPLVGVCFGEFFCLSRADDTSRARIVSLVDRLRSVVETRPGLRAGVQPHAPYSVSAEMFLWSALWAAERGVPVATHLAESPEECRLIAHGDGPLRDMLERLGVWNDWFAGTLARPRSPVEHFTEGLIAARPLAAHVNACSESDLKTLARSGVTVAYCPRCSSYFGRERDFGPHRYRDMLSAGIPVVLGTDSVINLPPDQSDRLSTLDEVRFLSKRDGSDALTLMAMATTLGAAALGLEPDAYLFPGADRSVPAVMAGLNIVRIDPAFRDEPVAGVMLGEGPPALLSASGEPAGPRGRTVTQPPS